MEFLTEIESLKGQKHQNLISLLGYCDDNGEKIIVYEYANNGSLDRYLRPNRTICTLSWLERLRICVDIARGLDHLHNHARKSQPIIHRDIKSSNILLDGDWVAKISDLGLSKLSFAGLDGNTVISHACGTPCYVEPEYMSSNTVSEESDVFSFGMVLLEILSGRLCTIPDDNGFLLSQYYKKKILDTIVDPNLRQQITNDSFDRFLSIAYGCLHEDRKQRHPINRVVKVLEHVLENAINEDGKKSQLVSSDDLQDLFSEVPFNMLLTRRTDVAKIFNIFDFNKDGGLSRKEVAAFLFVTKHGEEQLTTCIDEVFSLYHKYIDGKKGFSYHGLLKYYDDGHSDLDSDTVELVSDSHGSNKRKKLMWLFEKLNSYKDCGFDEQELPASHKSLLGKIAGLPVKVFNWYRERGLTSGGILTKDDDDVTKDQSGLYSEMLELLLKPDDGEAAAFLIPTSQLEDRDMTKLLILLITLLILPTTLILVKLKHVVVLSLFLFNFIEAFLVGRRKMH